MLGKTITLFLIDGEPNGRMTGELSNWTGKAYKIPRTRVKNSGDRSELKNTGIYMLFGRQEDHQNNVYIGEAENVFKRLGQQLAAKEFWTEAVIFISKDENLNKAHIKYLENRLYQIAQNRNRYNIKNSTIPAKPSISEPDEAEMEAFISNIKILTNTLGHKVFEEKREIQLKGTQKQNIFYINAARGAEASGEPTSEGFVIFEGSKLAYTEVDSVPHHVHQLRNRLIEEKVVSKKDQEYVLTEDYLASSPSTAAALVTGRSANGLIEWKLNNNKTLKKYESTD